MQPLRDACTSKFFVEFLFQKDSLRQGVSLRKSPVCEHHLRPRHHHHTMQAIRIPICLLSINAEQDSSIQLSHCASLGVAPPTSPRGSIDPACHHATCVHRIRVAATKGEHMARAMIRGQSNTVQTRCTRRQYLQILHARTYPLGPLASACCT